MPVGDRVGLDILEDGVVVVRADSGAGADLAVVGAVGELGELWVREDLAKVLESLDCDGAVGIVRVVLFWSAAFPFLQADRRQASQGEMLGGTYVGVDVGCGRHGGPPESDVAARQSHHAARCQGNVRLIGERRVEWGRPAGVEDGFEQVLDVRLVAETGIYDGAGANVPKLLFRESLEPVGNARWGRVHSGAVGVEFLLGVSTRSTTRRSRHWH